MWASGTRLLESPAPTGAKAGESEAPDLLVHPLEELVQLVLDDAAAEVVLGDAVAEVVDVAVHEVAAAALTPG